MDKNDFLPKIGICQWCLPDHGYHAVTLATELGCCGIEMDMGLNDPVYNLMKPEVVDSFMNASKISGIEISSLALKHLYLNRGKMNWR